MVKVHAADAIIVVVVVVVVVLLLLIIITIIIIIISIIILAPVVEVHAVDARSRCIYRYEVNPTYIGSRLHAILWSRFTQ